MYDSGMELGIQFRRKWINCLPIMIHEALMLFHVSIEDKVSWHEESNLNLGPS